MRALRTATRLLLAAALVAAGLGHLTTLRRGFRAAVPDWATRLFRTDKDTIVVVSGVVEILLGGALVALPRERGRVGALVGAFFVAVFPGNVHHWLIGKPVPPLLVTDTQRFVRLFLQPVLVAWAIWSTRPDAERGTGRVASVRARAPRARRR